MNTYQRFRETRSRNRPRRAGRLPRFGDGHGVAERPFDMQLDSEGSAGEGKLIRAACIAVV